MVEKVGGGKKNVSGTEKRRDNCREMGKRVKKVLGNDLGY